MIKKFLHEAWIAAMKLNKQNLLDLLDYNPKHTFLDLGCDDGEWTYQIQQKVGSTSANGVEIIESSANKARIRGIDVTVADLSNPLPFADESFDIVHGNQVIEHVPNIDLFLSEIFRVLRQGGYAVLSTENGSSWVNIGAAILGWQIFSLTNVSNRVSGLGNPCAIHRGEQGQISSWTHKTIFNYRGLKEICEVHGFSKIDIKGAGYFPLPALFGKLDPRHAHFITVRAEKLLSHA